MRLARSNETVTYYNVRNAIHMVLWDVSFFYYQIMGSMN